MKLIQGIAEGLATVVYKSVLLIFYTLAWIPNWILVGLVILSGVMRIVYYLLFIYPTRIVDKIFSFNLETYFIKPVTMFGQKLDEIISSDIVNKIENLPYKIDEKLNEWFTFYKKTIEVTTIFSKGYFIYSHPKVNIGGSYAIHTLIHTASEND